MRKVKLDEVAVINPRKSEIDKGEVSDVSFVAMADVSEDGFIANHETRHLSEVYKSYTYFRKGDVLLAKITPCFENGKAAIANNIPNEVGFGSSEFHVLRPNGSVLAEYLFYTLWNKQFRLTGSKKMTGSAGQKRVPTKFLKEYEIPLPSLDEQKAIVAKLDRAQRLIDIDQAMLAKYDELIQSVFLEMFGDPVTNPKGWEVKKFDKIAEIDKQSFDPTDFEGEVNYVGLENIEKDSGKLVEVGTIVEGDLKSNKYKFTSDHILYGKLRPYLNKVAFPYSNGVCSTDILPIKPIEGISIKYFIGYLLKSREFVNYADKNSSGANLPRISPKIIRKFDSFLPPIELQIQFDSFVEKINYEKKKTESFSQNSQELFSSLLQQAFS